MSLGGVTVSRETRPKNNQTAGKKPGPRWFLDIQKIFCKEIINIKILLLGPITEVGQKTEK